MTRLALFLCASVLAAQPPAPAPPHAYKLPPIYETKLPNGLTVVLAEDSRLPLATVRLAFSCGSRRDPEALPGLAAAVAEIMTQATHNRASMQLGEALGRLGGSIAGASGADSVSVEGSIVSAHIAELLDVVADVARNAEFADLDLLRYKQTRRQSLARQFSMPAFVAEQTFRKELFGAHPDSHIGPTPQSLAALTRKALVEYRDRWFLPNNAWLIVVGRFPPRAEMMKLVTANFGNWEQKPLPEPQKAPLPKPAVKRILIDRPGALQADIRMGTIVPPQRDADAFGALLAATSGGTKELHVETTWLDEAGIVSFTAHIDNERLPGLFEARPREVDVRGKAARSFFARLETQAGLADELMTERIQNLPGAYLETWRAHLDAAKPDSLRADTVVVVVGDAAKIQEPLEKKLGKFEVIRR